MFSSNKTGQNDRPDVLFVEDKNISFLLFNMSVRFVMRNSIQNMKV